MTARVLTGPASAAPAGPGTTPPGPARLAARVGAVGPSVIRELLALTARPDVLSLAGGLPAAESLPVDWLAGLAAAAFHEHGPAALQYSTTEGDSGLRGLLAGLEADWCGRPVGADELLVTAGSQQALNLVATVLVDPGDEVGIEEPAYVGAIQAFRLAGARLTGLPTDDDGLRTGALADRLRAGWRPRAVYVTPTFANPTGSVLSPGRRAELAGLAERYGFWLVEDDAYRMLAFDGTPPPPVAAHGPHVLRLGSTSKFLGPGLRVGWLLAPPAVRAAAVRAKQAGDLHTATVNQLVVAAALADRARLDRQLAQVRTRYAERCAALTAALNDAFDGAVQVPVVRGGMFLWTRFPAGTDTDALLTAALRRRVAFVPGSAFGLDGAPTGSGRLCFATLPPAALADAAGRLAAAHREPGAA